MAWCAKWMKIVLFAGFLFFSAGISIADELPEGWRFGGRPVAESAVSTNNHQLSSDIHSWILYGKRVEEDDFGFSVILAHPEGVKIVFDADMTEARQETLVSLLGDEGIELLNLDPKEIGDVLSVRCDAL